MMEKKWFLFASNLMQKYSQLKIDGGKVIQNWAPNDPPEIILFAAFGRSIGNYFDSYHPDERKALFIFIEDGMTSDDEELSIAVATGLIEALVSVSDKKEGLWTKLEVELGPRSKAHAIAWRDFGNAA